MESICLWYVATEARGSPVSHRRCPIIWATNWADTLMISVRVNRVKCVCVYMYI